MTNGDCQTGLHIISYRTKLETAHAGGLLQNEGRKNENELP